MGDLPVWAPCLYDARIAPADVIETAQRRHHHLLDPDGTQRANDAFEPATGLADFLTPPLDPLEQATPALELVDPTPSSTRAALSQIMERLVTVDQADDLVLATSEAVANALAHGVPPVVVRIWLGQDRVVVNIHDQGDGPVDPLAGLLPTGGDDAESGRGLWLANQLDIDVALIAAGDGFTVRLRAGNEQLATS